MRRAFLFGQMVMLGSFVVAAIALPDSMFLPLTGGFLAGMAYMHANHCAGTAEGHAADTDRKED